MSALASRIAAEFAATPRGDGAANAQRRQLALTALCERGLPTARDENWKYSNLRALEKVRFATPAVTAAIETAELPAAIPGFARYTFLDGTFCPALSTAEPRAGVHIESLADFRKIRACECALPGDLRLLLLNDAFATGETQIRVASGTDCPACVELLFVATADAKSGASYPRVDLQVGAGARIGVIERHLSLRSDSSFINSAVNVELARDAAVNHYRIQQTGSRTVWFDTLTASLQENSRYRIHGVDLGGLSSRSTVRVELLGQQAEVGLFNAAVGARNQVHDTFALIEHIAPNARTEQTFRGIAAGRSRVACNSKIVVRKDAHGSDSRQSLRGLLAGPDAEIDVRPQLEIYTDDVRCNHGATAGKLDDNMLFYLLSRGLEPDTAQRLLKWAFLEDVVAKIAVPELRRQIEQSLAGQLEDSAALQELL